MTRKIVFYGAITLDGYLATSDDQLEWLFNTAGGDQTDYADFEKSLDTTVMGRVTYEEAKRMVGTDALYPNMTNYVFSRTMQDFPDAIGVNEDPVSFLKKLKEQPGKNIWIVGGGQLLKPILEADLIDEWWIQIAPVLLGEGKPLFEVGSYQRRLQLVEIKQFDQFAELHYQRQG